MNKLDFHSIETKKSTLNQRKKPIIIIRLCVCVCCEFALIEKVREMKKSKCGIMEKVVCVHCSRSILAVS